MPPSSNLQEFHLFPKLPTELRLKIWRLALLTPPRLIPLFHNAFTSTFILVHGLTPRNGHDWSLTSTSHSIPSNLQSIPFVSREPYNLFTKSPILYLKHNISISRTTLTPYHPPIDTIRFSQRVEPGTLLSFAIICPLAASATIRLAIVSLRSPVQVLLEMRALPVLEVLYIEHQPRTPNSAVDCNDWWAEGLEKPYDTKWELQEAITKVTDGFRDEWPEWRVPEVRVVEHWDEILAV